MFNVDNYIQEESADCDADDIAVDATAFPNPRLRKRFYVGEGNGWKMVRDELLKRGDWIQIPFDQGFTQNYNLRWVERRSEIDYGMMKSKYQASNHISNNDVITTKKGLVGLNRLRIEEEKADEYHSEDKNARKDFKRISRHLFPES